MAYRNRTAGQARPLAEEAAAIFRHVGHLQYAQQADELITMLRRSAESSG